MLVMPTPRFLLISECWQALFKVHCQPSLVQFSGRLLQYASVIHGEIKRRENIRPSDGSMSPSAFYCSPPLSNTGQRQTSEDTADSTLGGHIDRCLNHEQDKNVCATTKSIQVLLGFPFSLFARFPLHSQLVEPTCTPMYMSMVHEIFFLPLAIR